MLSDEKLSPHFQLSEFTHSQAAARLGLPNEPGPAALNNLRRLAQHLERVREVLGGVPLIISSGYRSVEVNRAVGGAARSAHLAGLAADFTAPRFGTPREVCRALAKAGIPFDQLIYEGTWVHFAVAPAGSAPRGEKLTAVFHAGGPTTYLGGFA